MQFIAKIKQELNEITLVIGKKKKKKTEKKSYYSVKPTAGAEVKSP